MLLVPASAERPAACDDREVADSARARREAIRQLADMRRKLAAAEDTLAAAQAAMKRAETAAGMRSILLHAGFSATLTWQVLQRFGVTNFAAAPTIYRALRASDDQPAGYRLRRASSAGEPLTPDIVAWSTAALGAKVRDHYGQTEHGMLIVNGWHNDVRSEVRPGSMGQSLPGFR